MEIAKADRNEVTMSLQIVDISLKIEKSRRKLLRQVTASA